MESRTFRRPALCPACGAPGLYVYDIKGPIDKDGERFIEVSYSFRCEICGHEDAGRLLVPLEAIYRLRHIMLPDVMAVVERMKVMSEVGPLSARLGAQGEAQGQA